MFAVVRHPNIVRVHDLVIEGSTLAIVMELIEGSDLTEVLRQQGTIEPAKVARWGANIAAALSAAHERGVVHRDVKPANVLVDAHTGDAKLSDFGIARLIDASTRSTTMVGTPQYFAPEAIEGRPTGPAADVYALGIMLYELCCGVRPFADRRSIPEVCRAHLEQAPGRPPGVPDPMWALIARMTAKAPHDRPLAAEVESSLHRLVGELAGLPPAQLLSAPPPPTPTPAVPPPPTFVPVGSSHVVARPAPQPHPGAVGGASRAPTDDPPGSRGGLARAVIIGALVGLVIIVGVAIPLGLLGRVDSAGQSQPVADVGAPLPTKQPESVPAPPVAVPTTASEPQQPPTPEVPAGPAVAPAPVAPRAVDVQARQEYADALVRSYLDQANNGVLRPQSLEVYFTDEVLWYGRRGLVPRPQLWEFVRIKDPQKPRTAFDNPTMRSFNPAQPYRGGEADVIEYEVPYQRPNGENGTVRV